MSSRPTLFKLSLAINKVFVLSSETLIQELRQPYQNKSKSVQKQEQIQLLKQHDSLLFQVTKAKIQNLTDSYESLFLKSSSSSSRRRKDDVENSKGDNKKPRPPLPPSRVIILIVLSSKCV
jgi:hypothetical protein